MTSTQFTKQKVTGTRNADKLTKEKTKVSEYNEHICSICGKRFTGYGNNPWPVVEEGGCCDECYKSRVIPTRQFFDKQGINEDNIEKHNVILKEVKEGKTNYFIPFIKEPNFAMVEYGLCTKENDIDDDLFITMFSKITSSLMSFYPDLTSSEAECVAFEILKNHVYSKLSQSFSEEKYWKNIIDAHYRVCFEGLPYAWNEWLFFSHLESGKAKVNLLNN